MTPRQRSEMKRLTQRVRVLERRSRILTSKTRLDRLAWLVNEIEEACPRPGARGNLRVSRSDARLLRPLLEALVSV